MKAIFITKLFTLDVFIAKAIYIDCIHYKSCLQGRLS